MMFYDYMKLVTSSITFGKVCFFYIEIIPATIITDKVHEKLWNNIE